MIRYVKRFSRTERTLHWVNALCFFFLLATGLILYLPSLAVAVGRRPLIKDMHFWSGISWISLLALVALLVGHLYLALIHPATRHSLRGMTLGEVREDWARVHYPRWIESGDRG